MNRPLFVAALVTLLTACSETTAPPAQPQLKVHKITAQELFARYVSVGTSNSMGVQAAGVYGAAQRAAWPAQLAAHFRAPYRLPLMQDPGCPPRLLEPLAANLVLLGAFALFGAGEDLVAAASGVCMPLQPGVSLPANNVAISGAKTRDALYSTPEVKGDLYSRVLLPGQTQVSAMLAHRPTLISIELGANEVLPASTGNLAAMTPFADWVRDYDLVIAAVRTTGAAALLVGLPANAANFPSVRPASEFAREWAALLTLGITVGFNCFVSTNHIFVPGYLLSLVQRAPTTATCANVPGTVDYVLTANDIAVINTRMAQMNAHIQTHATAHEFAYFSIDAVYGLPKPRFSVLDVLFSGAPFGAYMSLDGVHPNAQGQALLADAAAQALRARYGI